MNVPVLNMKGATVGQLAIDAETLGGEINPALIKQAYVMYHANTRVGTTKTLNRENVEGSTKKIVKQKGSGGARHGDRKVPHFRGGSHAHHKQRVAEDYHKSMPKKMRRKANLNALLAKLIDNEVKIVDTLSMNEPRTKEFATFLEALKIDRSALVAVGIDNANVRKSARNLESVELVPANQLNAFNMLNNRYLVIAKSDLEAYLTGPWSQTTKDAKLAPKGAKRDGDKKPAAKRDAKKESK